MIAQQLFTSSTIVSFILALILTSLISWRVSPERFRSLSWQTFGISSAAFWSIFAAILILSTWDNYYSHFVPSWYRVTAPLGAIFLYGLAGVFLRWAALRIPGHPVLWFCLLGGLEALPEHLVGIYRFDILDIPILQGSRAVDILVFAYFEYVVYWSIVLILALVLDRLYRVIRQYRIRDEG